MSSVICSSEMKQPNLLQVLVQFIVDFPPWSQRREK